MTFVAYLLTAAIGFPLGYFLGWLNDEANRRMEAYLDGIAKGLILSPEVWR